MSARPVLEADVLHRLDLRGLDVGLLGDDLADARTQVPTTARAQLRCLRDIVLDTPARQAIVDRLASAFRARVRGNRDLVGLGRRRRQQISAELSRLATRHRARRRTPHARAMPSGCLRMSLNMNGEQSHSCCVLIVCELGRTEPFNCIHEPKRKIKLRLY